MFTLRRLPIFFRAVVLAAALLAITPLAAAKGNFTKVVVYGDGVAVESFDPSLIAYEAFNSFSRPYPGTPSITVEGYLIVRFGQDPQTGEYIAVDSLRFFPTSLSAGSKPFVYYEGLVNGWSEADQRWYEAKPEAAAAVQRLLNSEAERSPFPELSSPMALVVSSLVGLTIGMIGMALIRRITRHRSTSAAAQQAFGQNE